jgi:hypothetical protein
MGPPFDERRGLTITGHFPFIGEWLYWLSLLLTHSLTGSPCHSLTGSHVILTDPIYLAQRFSVRNLGMDFIENTASNNVPSCCVRIYYRGNEFIESLPRNGQWKYVTISNYSLKIAQGVWLMERKASEYGRKVTLFRFKSIFASMQFLINSSLI